MKPAPITNTLTQSANFKSSRFKIKQSGLAHVFDIPRNQLYSNKVLAVVREYATNAIDAHSSIGKKDLPIEITMPNRFHLFWECRDFGPGLSEEGIDETYIVYGDSTKRDTNDEVGEKGIGSKCGFAYGDSFIVESIHEGIKYIYNAILDPSGIGEMTLFDKSPSKEKSGIKIQVPVRNDDVDSFHANAANLYAWFPVQPKITNIQEITWQEKIKTIKGDEIMEGDGWSIRSTGQTLVRMGCLTYPLDTKALNIDQSQSLYDMIQHHAVIIDVPIGSISIAASREKLGYDERTIKTITDKLIEVETALIKKLEKEIINSPTLWEARKKAKVLESSATAKLLHKIRWNGYTVHESNYSFTEAEATITRFGMERSYYGKRNNKMKRVIHRSFNLEEDQLIIFDDYGDKKGKCIPQRIYPYLKGLKLDPDFVKMDQVLILRKLSEYDTGIKRNGFDYEDITLLSSLKKYKLDEINGHESKVGSSGPKSSKASTKQLMLKSSKDITHPQYGYADNQDWFDVSSIDLDDGGVCFEVSGYKIVGKGIYGENESPRNFAIDIERAAKAFGITLPVIYGLKPKTFEKYIEKDNWTNITDWIKEQIQKKIDTVIIHNLKLEKVWNQFRDSNYPLDFDDLNNISNLIKKTNPNSHFVSLMGSLETAKVQGNARPSSILNDYKIKCPETDKNPLDNISSLMLCSYPILEFMDRYGGSSEERRNQFLASYIIKEENNNKLKKH